MTYNEAIVFKESNIQIVGQQSPFLNHTIDYLLIAPYDIAVRDITTVYRDTKAAGSNELALQNLGYFNGDMDVYVIWEAAAGQVEQMRLVAYLSAVAQR